MLDQGYGVQKRDPQENDVPQLESDLQSPRDAIRSIRGNIMKLDDQWDEVKLDARSMLVSGKFGSTIHRQQMRRSGLIVAPIVGGGT